MSCRNSPKRRARLRMLCAPIALCAVAARAATADPTEQCIVGDHAIGCLSERSIIELTTPRKNANTLQELVQDKLASGQCRLFDYGERVRVTSTHGNERTQIRRPGDKTSYWIPATWSRPASECKDTPTAAALHQKLGLPDAPREPADGQERVPSFADERESRYAEQQDPTVAERDPYFADRRVRPFADARDRAFADERMRSFADARAAPGHQPHDGYDDDNGYGDDERYSDDDRYGDDDRDADAYDRARHPPRWPSRPLPSSRYAHNCAYKSVMTDADLAACRNPRR